MYQGKNTHHCVDCENAIHICGTSLTFFLEVTPRKCEILNFNDKKLKTILTLRTHTTQMMFQVVPVMHCVND